jgi:hypothetical protein
VVPILLTLNRGVTDVLDGRDLAPVTQGLEDMERLGLRFRLACRGFGQPRVLFAGDIDAADKWWRCGLQLGRRWATCGRAG